MISDWEVLFEKVKAEPYSSTLKSFLDEEYASRVIYPPRKLMYNAFAQTSPSSLKAVIIGQDPYSNPGQAMGLSFSVPHGIPLPPSLINVYKEIESDLGITMDYHNGDLTPWAKQGVLLLNSYLSVRAGIPLSHKREEYDRFAQDVMEYLDTLDQPIVFLLWGGFARKFRACVHHPNHLVLEAAHPSPLSANRGGFFGCRHFSKANDYLLAHGSEAIQWKI